MSIHGARIVILKLLYSAQYIQETPELYRSTTLATYLLESPWIPSKEENKHSEFIEKVIRYVLEHEDKLADIIKKRSEHWDYDRISPINKAILFLSLAQLLMKDLELPPKVIIDEALELSKEFAETGSSRYINGILDQYFQTDYKATETTSIES